MYLALLVLAANAASPSLSLVSALFDDAARYAELFYIHRLSSSGSCQGACFCFQQVQSHDSPLTALELFP